jgi:hypothetical protein
MASWKEERDRLVAQTLAFVQQVASAHPVAASKLGLTSTEAPVSTETSVTSASPPVIAAVDASIVDTAALAAQFDNAAAPANLVADLSVRPPQYSTASERSDITRRVAAFKARQTTLNREREAYYDSVQARIRSSLRNDTDSNML